MAQADHILILYGGTILSLVPLGINSNLISAKLFAKRIKRENRKIFAKPRTSRATDALQEYSLTIYKTHRYIPIRRTTRQRNRSVRIQTGQFGFVKL